MTVPIILLNYNSSADCAKCISFLKRQREIDIEIVVVDNCSREDDLIRLRALCESEPLCTLIENHENRGYNAGNNIGLRYAAEKGYKYAMIANPDMEFPQEDYVAKLVAKMEEDEEIVVCGSDIVGTNGERQNPWRFSSFWKDFIGNKIILDYLGFNNKVLPPISGYCDILTGCCLMVQLEYIKSQNYFDENVFLFCEEAILGKQVRNKGKKMYYLNETFAIHRHLESQKGSYIRRYRAFENSRCYFLKYYSGYNYLELSVIFLSRKVQFLIKMCLFHIKGIV